LSSAAAPPAVRLWKTFRSKPNTIPVDEQNGSPSHRNGVRLQNGMLFGFTTEWCSPSERNRIRLRPDSPIREVLMMVTAAHRKLEIENPEKAENLLREAVSRLVELAKAN
jgi:hypothetical protein